MPQNDDDDPVDPEPTESDGAPDDEAAVSDSYGQGVDTDPTFDDTESTPPSANESRQPAGQSTPNQGQVTPSQNQSASDQGQVEEKDPMIAGLLSFLIPGIGHFYNQDPARGVFTLAVWVIWLVMAAIATMFTFGIFLLIAPFFELLIHVGAAYDSYNNAQIFNAAQ